METRDLYRQKYEAQIKEWGAKIVELQAHVQKATAQAKIDLAPHLDGAHRTVEAARTKAAHIAQATDESWEKVRHDADAAWQDAKAAVQGAYDAITKHVPKSS